MSICLYCNGPLYDKERVANAYWMACDTCNVEYLYLDKELHLDKELRLIWISHDDYIIRSSVAGDDAGTIVIETLPGRDYIASMTLDITNMTLKTIHESMDKWLLLA